MTQSAAIRLARVLAFVRSHSPGDDAVLDEQNGVVRWTGIATQSDGTLQHGTCLATTLAEARDELGY